MTRGIPFRSPLSCWLACCLTLPIVAARLLLLHAVPGVDKIPNFEEVFVQFLQAACSSNGISSPSAGHVAAHS